MADTSLGRPFARRLGPSPRERGCDTQGTCPDVFELGDGDFAFIGRDFTDPRRQYFTLPPDAGCGDGERLVVVPRGVVLGAFRRSPPSSGGAVVGQPISR